MSNKKIIEEWRKIIEGDDYKPTIESEGITEEELHNPDDAIHPQQR